MGDRKMYRYRVVKAYPAAKGRVKVDDILVDRWHGKSHLYQIERLGNVAPLCEVELVGPHELVEAQVRAVMVADDA